MMQEETLKRTGIDKWAAHEPSNLRARTDEYLLPEHLNGAVQASIAHASVTYPLEVRITDGEIAFERQCSNNTMSFGDAVEKILKREIAKYPCMVYWEPSKTPTGIRFDNAYYDIEKGMTHYFYTLKEGTVEGDFETVDDVLKDH